MTITHSWSINEVFAHPLNKECIYKIKCTLLSTDGFNTQESKHTFYVAPNILPEAIQGNKEFNSEPEIIWVDSEPNFISISELTEAEIWAWIDQTENRKQLEKESEQKFITEGIPVSLSFLS